MSAKQAGSGEVIFHRLSFLRFYTASARNSHWPILSIADIQVRYYANVLVHLFCSHGFSSAARRGSLLTSTVNLINPKQGAIQMKIVALVFAVILSCLSTGCSTLADAKAGKGTGESRIYDKEYDVVWKATIDTIKESDLQLVTDSKEQGMILAQRGMTAFSYGENVAIFLDSLGGQIRTRVEVVNKRALATNITAAGWESRILDNLDRKLK